MSSLHYAPSFPPQIMYARSERLGYGGDMLAAAEAAILQFDVAAFYEKRV